MRRLLLTLLFLAAALAPAHSGRADTLAQIRDTGVFKLGFRMDAKPMSFLDENGDAAGYAVDICRRVATAVKVQLGLDSMKVEYVPVSAENRIQMLLDGAVDIECATSTRTLERQAKVDFTLLTFVTGAAMLTRVESNIDDLPDLAGRKIGVLGGTTTEEGLRRALQAKGIAADIMLTERHEYGMASLETKEIDAYFADRILLLGLAGRAIEPKRLKLSSQLYSYEPYAFMVRRGDTDLRLIADRTIASIYRSGEIEDIYRTWFGDAKAGNLLRALFVLQAIPER
jgi:ABC-type amino acid transport substrate-binding protein